MATPVANSYLLKSLWSRSNWTVFFCLSLIVSMYSSKYVLSVSMFGLLAVAFCRRDYPEWLRTLARERVYWFPMLFFFVILGSGLYSEDTSSWLERLRIRLPFLGLPIAFASLPRLSRRQYYGVMSFFVIISAIVALGVSVLYMRNFEEFTQRLSMGQALKTPINHILFSLLICIATVAGWELFRNKFSYRFRSEPYIMLGISLFLVAFLHILSVRSGLIALYICWTAIATGYVWRTRKFALGFAVIVSVAALPLLAYQFVPSFKTRMDYARWDIAQYRAGQGNMYSDSDRLTSISLGLKIGNAHPIFGVGAGDVRQQMTAEYLEIHPEATKILIPHNQFVNAYAGTGLVGLLLFLIAFLGPLFGQRHHRDTFLVGLHIIFACSFLSESTIETAIGTAIFLFFLLFGLHKYR